MFTLSPWLALIVLSSVVFVIVIFVMLAITICRSRSVQADIERPSDEAS